MEKVKDIILFSIAGIFIAFRFFVNQSPFELSCVAGITVISLLYVLFSIEFKLYNTEIATYDLPNYPKIAARKQKSKLKRALAFNVIALIAFSFSYVLEVKSSAMNDTLAIVTLVMSLEDSFIVSVLTKK